MYLNISGETRKSLEVKRLTLRQRIANLERTVIRQTDNISRPSLIDSCLALRHELRRRRETHRLAMTHMQVQGIAYKLPGTDFAESDTWTVVLVDIGGYLKDEACPKFSGSLAPPHVLPPSRDGDWEQSPQNAIQQFLHTKLFRAEPRTRVIHLSDIPPSNSG